MRSPSGTDAVENDAPMTRRPEVVGLDGAPLFNLLAVVYGGEGESLY